MQCREVDDILERSKYTEDLLHRMRIGRDLNIMRSRFSAWTHTVLEMRQRGRKISRVLKRLANCRLWSAWLWWWEHVQDEVCMRRKASLISLYQLRRSFSFMARVFRYMRVHAHESKVFSSRMRRIVARLMNRRLDLPMAKWRW